MKQVKQEKTEEPPTELEMRNRHVRTTETMIRNWTMYTKLLIQRLGRAHTHKLVDMVSDQAQLEPNGDGAIISNPVTDAERDYQEVENKIVDMIIPDDDKLTHGMKTFFKDESYVECSTDGCHREAEHILEAQSSENEEKLLDREMCSQCKQAVVKTSLILDRREMRFYPYNE